MGGAVFNGNFVEPNDNNLAGDGGAVWNGPGAELRIYAGAYFQGNSVGFGGRGGGLWNEGSVEIWDGISFTHNEVRMKCILLGGVLWPICDLDDGGTHAVEIV